MNTTTKYQIGNTLFYMDGDDVFESVVEKIKIEISTGISVRYTFARKTMKGYRDVPEEKCFLTKQELIDSL